MKCKVQSLDSARDKSAKCKVIVRVQSRTYLKNINSFYGNFSPRTVWCRARRIITSFFLLITYHLSLITPIFAQSPSPGVNIGDKFGFGDIKSLGEATTKLVVPGFSVAAAIVVLYFLFGAFKYLQSRGNKEEVAAAREIIIHSIIGFIILMFAFLILQFLLSFLFETTGLGIIKT